MDPVGEALLKEAADVVVAPDARPDTLRQLADSADFLVVRNQLPADAFDHARRLLGVVRHGTGLDFIPVEAATEKQIAVANVPGANAQAVAEYTVGAMLNLTRRLNRNERALRERGWDEARKLVAGAGELQGATLGIVGVGAIGAAIARICSLGFGMRVLGYQRRMDALPGYVQGATLEQLFANSDFIALACPLTPETRHLVNAGRLAAMKPGAYLVNAARGAVIDEAALLAALKTGPLAGAALDVFEQQPLPREHAFLQQENLLLSSHVAGITQPSTRKMSIGTAEQILAMLKGEAPAHLVNPQAWDGFLQRLHAFHSSP